MNDKEERDIAQDRDIVIDYQFADSISLSTLVKSLVEKGIVSAEELIAFEKELQNARQRAKLKEKKNNNYQNWIRQKARKSRWMRRITARLFGWEWKKKVKPRTEEEK